MNAKLRIALGAPLVGLVITWSLFFIGAFTTSTIPVQDNSGQILHLDVYWFLGGIAAFAAASVFSFRIADGAVAEHKSLASGAVLKFAGFSVVVSAAAGAVFAFVLFANSIGQTFSTNRLLETYVPIIVMAGVVVVSILQATVWRKSQSEPGAPADPRKRALALAWVIPIIGSALALIIGLLSYSGNQNVSVWVWVVTLSIIMASVLLGTYFASVARSLVKREVRENTVEVGGGASKLNFVLAVVFGAVVTVVAFVTGAAAATSLGSSNYDGGYTPAIEPRFSSDWWGNQFVPSLVFLLMSQAIIYFSVTLRHKNAE